MRRDNERDKVRGRRGGNNGGPHSKWLVKDGDRGQGGPAASAGRDRQGGRERPLAHRRARSKDSRKEDTTVHRGDMVAYIGSRRRAQGAVRRPKRNGMQVAAGAARPPQQSASATRPPEAAAPTSQQAQEIIATPCREEAGARSQRGHSQRQRAPGRNGRILENDVRSACHADASAARSRCRSSRRCLRSSTRTNIERVQMTPDEEGDSQEHGGSRHTIPASGAHGPHRRRGAVRDSCRGEAER